MGNDCYTYKSNFQFYEDLAILFILIEIESKILNLHGIFIWIFENNRKRNWHYITIKKWKIDKNQNNEHKKTKIILNKKIVPRVRH
jgi:hypothetical protein